MAVFPAGDHQEEEEEAISPRCAKTQDLNTSAKSFCSPHLCWGGIHNGRRKIGKIGTLENWHLIALRDYATRGN